MRIPRNMEFYVLQRYAGVHDHYWLFYGDVALQRQNRERAQLRPFSLFYINLTRVTANDVRIQSEVSNLKNIKHKTYEYTNATTIIAKRNNRKKYIYGNSY